MAGVSACREMSVGQSADGLEQAGPGQLVGDRDRVGRLPPAVQGGDGVEDVAVGGLVEVVGTAGLYRGGDGVAGQQHGAEQRLLGIQVVRRDAGGARAHSSPGVLDRLHHEGFT